MLAAGSAPVLDVRSSQRVRDRAHSWQREHLGEGDRSRSRHGFQTGGRRSSSIATGRTAGRAGAPPPSCGKRGYTNVRRYQLGLPVWRALGRTVQTDLEGLRYIVEGDRTAVLVDARRPDAAGGGTRCPARCASSAARRGSRQRRRTPAASRQGHARDRIRLQYRRRRGPWPKRSRERPTGTAATSAAAPTRFGGPEVIDDVAGTSPPGWGVRMYRTAEYSGCSCCRAPRRWPAASPPPAGSPRGAGAAIGGS